MARVCWLLRPRLVHLLDHLKRQDDIADLAGLAVPDQFHLALVLEQQKAILIRQGLSASRYRMISLFSFSVNFIVFPFKLTVVRALYLSYLIRRSFLVFKDVCCGICRIIIPNPEHMYFLPDKRWTTPQYFKNSTKLHYLIYIGYSPLFIRNYQSKADRTDKSSIKNWSTISYFDPQANSLVDAVILKIQITRCLVRNIKDQKSWNLPFYYLNLDNVDADIKPAKNAVGIPKNTLKMGARVGFKDKHNNDLFGEVIRLNQKQPPLKSMNTAVG